MRSIATLCALACLFMACGGRQRGAATVAAQCEVSHNLTGDDEVTGRVDRLEDGWLVALRLRVRVAATGGNLEVRGLGQVRGEGAARRCRVLEAGGDPGQPRFDEALCLDEFESLADIIAAAESSVSPGTTVVQEVRLTQPRRRRSRSGVAVDASAFQERAEVTRDRLGRIARLVRATTRGGREEVVVTYPSNETGRCIVAD